MDYYEKFLRSKILVNPDTGIMPDESKFPDGMFGFQKALTGWALRKGRSALFTGTGTGKTIMQITWASQAGKRVLGLAPLAVAKQTVHEAAKWNIEVKYAREESQALNSGITITNYEMIDRFNLESYGGIFLDESSILKDQTGKMRNKLIKLCAKIPMRLCCSATPAPNDIEEIANHAEFLGVMSTAEMKGHFFIHDDKGWRLRRHGRDKFYRWLASWSMTMNTPGDLGFDNTGYDLPALNIIPHYVESSYVPPGYLFTVKLCGIKERAGLRKATVKDRITKAVEIIEAEPNQQWMVWCGINDESRGITRQLKDAVEVKGPDKLEYKEKTLLGFAAGDHRILVSKPGICGHGLNFQNCARILYLGIDDSYEKYYQSLRRFWRFGQTREVNAHIVLSESEQIIYENVLRKEREAAETQANLIKHVRLFENMELEQQKASDDYKPTREMLIPDWIKTEGY